ncbi:caspase domain-containing protein [Hygrophoropsis aurantiaca]|uniref:Caspase domain-containing protein n=1 Tax=Hygrophoropsis aurantiaca TaxID=72124 RepID=A0ACB8AIT7_9AGAM|nr:caspase domain-containing protein [Hygrophoropsis aurantiaca]
MFGLPSISGLLRRLRGSPTVVPVIPTEKPAETLPQGKKKALLIGIKYKLKKLDHFGPIPVAHDDTRAMEQLLMDVYGYAKSDIVVMLDIKENVNTNLMPTHKNIIAQIQSLVRDAMPNDKFFFYYSGHGDQVTCKHHSESDGKDEVLLGCDGRKIIDNKLRLLLVQPLPALSQLVAIFDSCHSETVLDLDHTCNSTSIDQGLGENGDVNLLPEPSVLCGLPTPGVKSFFHKLKRARSPKAEPVQQPPDIETRGRTSVPQLTLKTDVGPGTQPWIVSPIRRVLSPMQTFACTGSCPLPDPQQKAELPRVISLSACRDSQLAYDDKEMGVTMTKFLIKNLRKEPYPTLQVLLDGLREDINEMTERRLQREASALPTHSHNNTMPRRRVTEITVFDPMESSLVFEARNHDHDHNHDDDQSEKQWSQKPALSSNYRLDLFNDNFDP